jgi:hypothetical protein
MRSGPWSPREELACLEELEVHGPAFFRDDVHRYTEAKVRCHFDKIQEAVVTRDIRQIKSYFDNLFSTATSSADRRAIFTRKLADAIAALEADDASRLERAQVASEEGDDVAAAGAVEAYKKAAKSVVDAAPAEKAALRVQRDALEEAAVNACASLSFAAQRPCPNSRTASSS